MNIAPQVFQTREAYEPRYSAPTLDVELVPARPSMSFVDGGSATWLTVAGATSYILQRKAGPVAWTTIASVEAVEGYNNTFEGPAVTFDAFYRVIAVNSVGASLPSHAMLLGPDLGSGSPPEIPVIIPDVVVSWGITASGFTARWEFQAGVDGYYISIGPDSDPAYGAWTDSPIGTVTEFAVTFLPTPPAFWTFKIRAANAFGSSPHATVVVTPGV